jgi:hypothetical protein
MAIKEAPHAGVSAPDEADPESATNEELTRIMADPRYLSAPEEKREPWFEPIEADREYQ